MLFEVYLGLIQHVFRIGSWLVQVLFKVGSEFLDGYIVRSCFRCLRGWFSDLFAVGSRLV